METSEPTASSNGGGRWIWAVIGGVVIVALIAIAVVLIPRMQGSGADTVNVTAAAIPSDTQIYFAFNPHFSSLPNGDIVLKTWGDSKIAAAFEDSVHDALGVMNLDWDQDIASWLGDEVAIGIGDLKFDELYSSFDPAPPSVVLVAATRDASQSDALLTRLRARADPRAEFTEQVYRDVATVEQSGGRSAGSLAYATVQNLIVVASEPDLLHAAIDAVLDGTGLDKSSKYQATLSKLRGGRAITAFMDVAPLFDSIVGMLERTGGLPPTYFDQDALDALEAIQGVAMGLSFEPNGLMLELIGVTDVSELPVESLAGLSVPGSPNRLLSAVPGSTFVYLGGNVSPDAFDVLRDDPNFMASMRMIESELGINLMEDVFGWLNGEIAFVLLPGSLTAGSSIPFGFALLVDTEDVASAEASLGRLMGVIADQTFSEIEETTVGDATLHAILDFSGEPTIVYGVLNDNVVVAFPGNAASKLDNAASSPLADDDTFKEATAPLPKSNGGYLYLNPKRIVDLVSLGLAFSGEECLACDLFEPVRAIAFASEQPQAEVGVQRSLMFVLLDVSE